MTKKRKRKGYRFWSWQGQARFTFLPAFIYEEGTGRHAGVINANLIRSPHASHERSSLSSSFINHLRRELSNNRAASQSFLFIVSDKARCSTFICNDAHVHRSALRHPRYISLVRDLDTRVNALSPVKFYRQFSPRHESIILIY